jgi:hypothetical protein
MTRLHPVIFLLFVFARRMLCAEHDFLCHKKSFQAFCSALSDFVACFAHGTAQAAAAALPVRGQRYLHDDEN